MTGVEICTLIINRIMNAIRSKEFCEQYRVGNHFTRVRKMTMELLIIFLFFKPKMNLPNSIDEFYCRFKEHIDRIANGGFKTISKQAVSKARKGIDIAAFEWIFDVTSEIYFQNSTADELWHGMRVFAIDGSVIQLPQQETVFNLYGVQKVKNNGEFPEARASYLYCSTSKIIVDALLETMDVDERELAKRHIYALSKKSYSPYSIIVYDRGYYSLELVMTSFNAGVHFVFRLKRSSKLVKNLIASGKSSMNVVVNDKCTGETKTIRIVRFKLDSGEEEYLATDLIGEEFTLDMFKELYFKRWAVETKYRQLKNRFELESFSGYSDVAIDQDFLIAAFYANIVEILRKDADKDVENYLVSRMNEKRAPQCRYRACESILVSRAKRYVPEMLFASKLSLIPDLCSDIVSFASTPGNRTQVIPNRHYTRQVKQPGRKYSHTNKPCE